MDRSADASMYQRVFEGHAEGALVLEDLIARHGGNLFVLGGEDGKRKTDFNLGKRHLLDFIVRRVNQANGVELEQQDEEAAP